MLAGLNKKNKIRQEERFSHQENSSVEILREAQECPNCQFSRLEKIDGEVYCPLCGYGHKRCG